MKDWISGLLRAYTSGRNAIVTIKPKNVRFGSKADISQSFNCKIAWTVVSLKSAAHTSQPCELSRVVN